ncbi:MAG: S8 family serine peptidase [Candidatus Omnitrophota bacterium]
MKRSLTILCIALCLVLGLISRGQSAPEKPKDLAVGPRPLLLRYANLPAFPGLDASAVTQAIQAQAAGKNFTHVIVQRDTIPNAELWETWRGQGITYSAYLGDRAWIIRVTLPNGDVRRRLDQAMTLLGAHSLTAMKPAYKTSPQLRLGETPLRSSDNEGNVKVIVSFFPGTPQSTIDALAKQYQRGQNEIDPLLNLTVGWWVAPGDIARIAEEEEVHFIEEGPFLDEPVMDIARANTGVDTAQGINVSVTPPTFGGWSGKGVRMSNSEGMDVNHDDFWSHNSAGARTTPRWLSCTGGDEHATMTAGIMLGNGWQSAAAGGPKYGYRGVAPQAIFSCPSDADVQNYSFVDTYGEYGGSTASYDDGVRKGRIRVAAVANQGITSQYGTEKGYYSVYRPSKNEIVVANFNPIGFEWNQSSTGPTRDGRLKPDISAPGASGIMSRSITGPIRLDIDWIQLARDTGTITWSFDNTGTNWHGGWGQDPWWSLRHMDTPVQAVEGGTVKMLRTFIHLPPYGTGWEKSPLIGSYTQPDGSSLLNINGAPNDKLIMNYRLSAIPPRGTEAFELTWSPKFNDYYGYKTPVIFRVIADGKWHTVTIPVGKYTEWNSLQGIQALYVRYDGAPMWRPALGNQYGPAGGSSASSPFLAGVVALLLDQVHTRFNMTFGDRTTKSPFWYGAPSTGQPLPSTFKAILAHTARDLAYVPIPFEQVNPDTNAVTTFHRGPDLVSGYGMVNAAEAVRLVAAHSGSSPYIVEREFTSSTPHTYTITVAPETRLPLKVTLAWDDPPASPTSNEVTSKLINNLDVQLTAPDGKVYYPWSIDLPYVPTDPSQYPGAIEPEPITAASIHPARRDIPNIRDNLEQAVVEFPQAGTWRVTVSPTSMGAPFPQKYSLILGMPAALPSHLSGGKVVFVSNRVTPQQLFIKDVDSSLPPVQITRDAYAVRHPAWSRDGKYIVYLTASPNLQGDVIKIIDAQGVVKGIYSAKQVIGLAYLGYPKWSPDGRRIVVTAFDEWNARSLKTLDFATPYNWLNYSVSLLIPPGYTSASLNPAEGSFSRDGQTVYFEADGDQFAAGLFSVPASGGTPVRLYGDGTPIRRAYASSISDDGNYLLFNSEMWKEGTPGFIDEELMELDIKAGTLTQMSREPGNQYGSFAINEKAYEYVVQSSQTPTGNIDIFLEENGVRVRLDINDPGNIYSDFMPQWWKPQ